MILISLVILQIKTTAREISVFFSDNSPSKTASDDTKVYTFIIENLKCKLLGIDFYTSNLII